MIHKKKRIPAPIGTIISDDFSANTIGSRWEAVGTGISISGGKLLTTTGSSTFGVSVSLIDPAIAHRLTCMQYWKITINYKALLFSASTAGIGIGIKSINNAALNGIIGSGTADTTTTRTVLRTIVNVTQTVIPTTQTSATLGSANDDYTLVFERNKDTYTSTFTNITKSITLVNTFTMPLTTPVTYRSPNTGKFTIWNFGGSYEIDSILIESAQEKNINVLYVGDSITNGFFGENTKYSDLVAAPSYSINAGSSDSSVEVLARIDELVAINPRWLYLAIGTNQSASYESDIVAIVQRLRAEGIGVILPSPSARTSTNLTALRTFLLNTFPHDWFVDQFTATKRPENTDMILSLSPDGLHPNPAGMQVLADTIKAQAPIVFS